MGARDPRFANVPHDAFRDRGFARRVRSPGRRRERAKPDSRSKRRTRGEVAPPRPRLGRAKRSAITPLTGGVSSDISLVEAGGRRFCVKRALPRLKVAALWEAPVERNAAEAAYLRAVSRWLPRAVPRVLGEDSDAGLFAMDYLPPERFPLWKAELLDGRVDRTFRRRGRARPRADPFEAARPSRSCGRAFAHDATFEAIRIEPYLRATARAHPALAARLDALAETTLVDQAGAGPRRRQPEEHSRRAGRTGVPRRRMRLVRRPGLRRRLLPQPSPAQGRARGRRQGALSRSLRGARRRLSRAASTGRSARGLEARAAALLPALFLARVDGKSPVEYLTRDSEREAVRRCATRVDRGAAANARRGRRRLEPRIVSEPVIQSVHGRRVWDSRGRPTVEAEIALERRGGRARDRARRRVARQPRGGREARRRRASRRARRPRRARKASATEIAPALIGADPFDQAAIDRTTRRAGRHGEPLPARRQRADRGFARGPPRGRGEPRAAAMASPRRRRARAHSAAGNPDFRRRRACRAAHRRAGLHDRRAAARKASPRRSRRRPRSITPRAKSWPSAACSWASPTRAAGGRRSTATSRRSTR